MKKKYKILKDDIAVVKYNHNTIIIYRIKALRDFGDVKKGDIGGYIEKESNLSHEGNCWIYDDAYVLGNARVCNNARVYNKAKIFGNAYLSGNSKIFDNARVFDNAQVFLNAKVHDNAKVFENAKVYNNAEVYGNSQVFGYSKVFGNAKVFNNSKVFGNSEVYDNAKISDNSKVYNTEVHENYPTSCKDNILYDPGKAKISDYVKAFGNIETQCNENEQHFANYDNNDIEFKNSNSINYENMWKTLKQDIINLSNSSFKESLMHKDALDSILYAMKYLEEVHKNE